MNEIDLSGLKDIHIPNPPSFWPPAIGWWIVLCGVVLCISLFLGVYLYWRSKPKQYALRELKKAYQESTNTLVFARQMSALFKRVVLIQYPRKRVASLSEEAWIRFLMTKTKESFSEEQAKLLAFSTYLPDNISTSENMDSLYKAGRRGIVEIFKRKKHGN